MSQDCVLVFAVLTQAMNGRLGFHGWQLLGRGMLMNRLYSIALLTTVLLAGCGSSKPPADAEALKEETLKLSKEKNYEAELPILRAAIQAREEQKGNAPVDLGDYYLRLGQILSFMDQDKEAIAAYDKAALINKKNMIQGLKLAIPIVYSAGCSVNLGDPQDAKARLEMAITLMQEAGDENSFELVSAMIDVSGIQVQKGKPEKAEEFLWGAITACASKIYLSPSICRIFNQLGEIRYLRGDNLEAVKYFEQALEGAVAFMPDNQWIIAQFRKNVEKAKLGN